MSDTPSAVKRFKAPGPWVTRELRDCVQASDYDKLQRELAARDEELARVKAERDASVKDAERHRAMREQFGAGKKASIYLPTAQPRFVDASTYSTPDGYEYDIDRAIRAAKGER